MSMVALFTDFYFAMGLIGGIGMFMVEYDLELVCVIGV